MDWFWWLVGVVAAVAWVVALVGMVRRRSALTRGQLAAWVLIVIILPVLGTILYFVIGRQPETRMSNSVGLLGATTSRLVPVRPR
jgi:hypothetical protein